MPKTIRRRTIHSATLRELTVVRKTHVSAGTMRVTLTGDELGGFIGNGFAQPEFRSFGFDDDLKVVLPYPGATEPVLPVQGDGKLVIPRDPRPLVREYTVRRFDSATGELDLDFVQHGTGDASTWARRCEPGDRVHVAGPDYSADFPSGVDWTLLAGDETALPAIGRWLETAPAGSRALVFVEVGGPGDEQTFVTAADAAVKWVHRGNEPAGRSTKLVEAIRSAPWPAGTVYAWVAGETMTIKDIRIHLRDERKVPKDHFEVTGYWRRTEVAVLDTDPDVPDHEHDEEHPWMKIHEMAELAPPYALRAAVTLGLPQLVSDGTNSIDALAVAAGVDVRALRKLLRYLTDIEVTVHDGPDRISLTPAGEWLTDDYFAEILDLNRSVAAQDRALLGLTESIRTGKSSYRTVTGTEFGDLRQQFAFESDFSALAAEEAMWLAPVVVDDVALRDAHRIAVLGDGGSAVAQLLVAARPDVEVSVHGLPTQLAVVVADLDDSISDPTQRSRISLIEQSMFETPTGSDAVVLFHCFGPLPDAEATLLVTRARASGSSVVVIETPLDEADDDNEHQYEEDLRNLCIYGTGKRTDAENRAVFTAAGATVTRSRTAGFEGSVLYQLG